MEEFEKKQELEISTQMNNIEEELEKEIELTAKCDQTRILKVRIKSAESKNDQEQVFLVNGRGLKIEAEEDSLLYLAMKSDKPIYINETTRNRHLKAGKLAK